MKLIKTEDEQGVMYSLSGDNLPENYVLSKENCDELFGVVDVEKLAIDIWKDLGVFTENDKHLWFGGFRNGFNKAMELNKDKVFTLEQMSVAYNTNRSGTLFEQLINSFGGQPTEIDVEIEMEEAQEIYRDGTVKYIRVPKLDSSGNLILKKI
jgi:hypothetical protein